MPASLVIRPETLTDYAAIWQTNVAAFGRDSESRLVEALRPLPGTFSLVAGLDTRIVGHICFSICTIETPANGSSASVAVSNPSIALAPVAVVPTHQRLGIGSALIRAGLAACAEKGHKSVILLGHADYYPRFGFVPASRFGISAPFPVPDEVFMALELVSGSLEGISGIVRYSPPFSSL